MPELPPDFRCRHSATSSKFDTGSLVRRTPTGWPVQRTRSPFHVQVSCSSLTWAKSSSSRGFQPGPLPSRNALGGAGPSSVRPQRAANVNTRAIPNANRTVAAVFMIRGSPGVNGSNGRWSAVILRPRRASGEWPSRRRRPGPPAGRRRRPGRRPPNRAASRRPTRHTTPRRPRRRRRPCRPC